MNQTELNDKIKLHKKWLEDEDDGMRLDLSDANLRGVNLSDADLRYADLNWVNWQDALGLTVISAQVNTSRDNNQISYIKELGIWTTGCFQGTLKELQESINKTHADNPKLKARYERVIDFILREAEEDE